MFIALALLSMLVELAFGYPHALMRAVGHPVSWIGALIAALDSALNREDASPGQRRARGVIAVVLIVAVTGATAVLLQQALGRLPLGPIVLAVLASSLIAQRSLSRHVADVAHALEKLGLAAARNAVSRIVGRDTEGLDESAVARAAIESLAENFSDGVVAPVLWLAIAGLPGLVLYKAINTADSMIGHRTPRHEMFGWAAARLDDLINLPASRLSALLFIAAAALRRDAAGLEAWRTVWRDAPRHRSPNAGYPEAAVAGSLGLSLAGPRSYGGVYVADATLGKGRRQATSADIRRALALYWTADVILIACLGLVAMVSAPM